jgi:hypothetical protein
MRDQIEHILSSNYNNEAKKKIKFQWYHIIHMVISNSYNKYIFVSKFEFKISPIWSPSDILFNV